MSRDRETTLDQFLDAGEEDEGNDVDGADGAGPDGGGTTEGDRDGHRKGADPAAEENGADGTGAVDPAEPTYRWTPDGEPCADCGERVERLWRAAGERTGAFVCAACKDWERGA